MFHQRFQQECTPGYCNNEGQPQAGAGLFGDQYGAGSAEVFSVIRKWRETAMKGPRSRMVSSGACSTPAAANEKGHHPSDDGWNIAEANRLVADILVEIDVLAKRNIPGSRGGAPRRI